MFPILILMIIPIILMMDVWLPHLSTYAWDNPSHWIIFFRGVETTNQICHIISCVYIYIYYIPWYHHSILGGKNIDLKSEVTQITIRMVIIISSITSLLYTLRLSWDSHPVRTTIPEWECKHHAYINDIMWMQRKNNGYIGFPHINRHWESLSSN